MYGYDPMYQERNAEREREVAELLREREYRRAFQPESSDAAGVLPSATRLPAWRRLAQALHLPLSKTAPRSA
jgi:hypothetical protein